MSKKCNNKVDCFVNGEEVWGHVGDTLCLHAAEEEIAGSIIPTCKLTGEQVDDGREDRKNDVPF